MQISTAWIDSTVSASLHRELDNFGFVAYIHCLCWTFCTHTRITVWLCSTHRCKISLISSNHCVHATWHIHTQPCPGEIEKPSFFGTEPLRKYWLWNNQIGRQLVLRLKKIMKIGLSAATTALRQHILSWGCNQERVLWAITGTGPTIGSSLGTFVWQMLYEKV